MGITTAVCYLIFITICQSITAEGSRVTSPNTPIFNINRKIVIVRDMVTIHKVEGLSPYEHERYVDVVLDKKSTPSGSTVSVPAIQAVNFLTRYQDYHVVDIIPTHDKHMDWILESNWNWAPPPI